MNAKSWATAMIAGMASLPAVTFAHAVGTDDGGIAGQGALVLLTLAAIAYAAGWQSLRQRSAKALPAAKAILFANGWLLTFCALVSPLDRLGSKYFWIHMVQHELLMLLCAPLIVLGRPGIVWLWSLPPPWRQATGQLLRLPATVLLWRFTSRPMGAALLHAIAVWVWHLPQAFEFALQDATVHAFQHLSFLFSAALFWHAVLMPAPKKNEALSAMLWIFLTCVHMSLLGALLLFSVRGWYPTYTVASGSAMALYDQRLGGIIMWVPGSLAYLLATALTMRQLLDARPLARPGAVQLAQVERWRNCHSTNSDCRSP